MTSAEVIIQAQKASFIGLGRLGLCTALKFEEAGWDIVGSDVFPSYVDSINSKTLTSSEPGVEEALRASKNLRATLSLSEAVNHSDLIFILVATPTGVGDEAYDTATLSRVLSNIAALKPKNKHIIICCTVMPGYIATTGSFLLEECDNCTLSYNPEFIAQGAIMHGLTNPDVVLIGEGSKGIGDVLEVMYQQATANNPRICRMSPASAEIMKLSVNCFVTTKITFANMIGDIADATPGANKFDILSAVGGDSRVGSKCILPGYGFGGPCFPRDNRALGTYARLKGIDPKICDATDEYNKFHAQRMTEELLSKGQDEYVISDVAYKPKCPVDIIEESQPIEIAKRLVRAGKSVIIKDRPSIIDLVKRTHGRIFQYETDDANPVQQQTRNPLSSYKS